MSEKPNEAIVDEWKGLIESCANRPKGMKIDEWCRKEGVSKSNYYNWKSRLKKSEEVDDDQKPAIVKVDSESLIREYEDYVDLDFKILKVRVTERTPMKLLSRVIGVIRDA